MKKVVVVTGAAGDIGSAIVKRFSKRGFLVAALDISRDSLQRLSESENLGDQLCTVETDITSKESVDVAFEQVRSKFGAINVLVNNAGGISAHNLKSTTEELWLRDIDLNLNGAWRCINNVIHEFTSRKNGVIVNIASVNGLGVYGHPGYSAAKAGLIHLTKFAAVELGPHGVRTVAICPGSVKTRAWIERQEKNPEILADAMKWYPSREASEPDAIAKMVEFAALDAPETLNGSVIQVDGGLTAGQDLVASAFCGDSI